MPEPERLPRRDRPDAMLEVARSREDRGRAEPIAAPGIAAGTDERRKALEDLDSGAGAAPVRETKSPLRPISSATSSHARQAEGRGTELRSWGRLRCVVVAALAERGRAQRARLQRRRRPEICPGYRIAPQGAGKSQFGSLRRQHLDRRVASRVPREDERGKVTGLGAQTPENPRSRPDPHGLPGATRSPPAPGPSGCGAPAIPSTGPRTGRRRSR